MPAPIFIAGSGRSGTTVLARLLSSHRDVVLVPIELRVHCDAGGLADAAVGRVPRGWLEERLRGYWKDRTSADGEPRGLTRFCSATEYDAAVDALVAAFEREPERAARQFVETLVGRYRGAGGSAWIEMSPPNGAAAEGLHRMFPGARFVHVVRSGLDVACSYRAQLWAPDDVRDCLLLWGDRVYDSVAGLRRIAPATAVTMRFEDIVSRPVPELSRLAGTLGLPADAFEQEAVGCVLAPDRAHVGRWRQETGVRDRPSLLALYLSQCRRLARVGLNSPPADLELARASWRELPLRKRIRGAIEARATATRWRCLRRRRWRWRPGRRLRLRAGLDRRRSLRARRVPSRP